MDSFNWLSNIIAVFSILVVLIFGSCGPTPHETPDYELDSRLAAEEWQVVKQAVVTMFEEENLIPGDLLDDERIDWEISAIHPDFCTKNMTGSINDIGERPLISLNLAASGTAIKPVSFYLGRDRTNSSYWIDNRGGVHLCEGSYVASDDRLPPD